MRRSRINRKALGVLTRSDLINIIASDELLSMAAMNAAIRAFEKRINFLLDEMADCDMHSSEGWKRYWELDAKIKKLEEAQEHAFD